MSGVDWTKVSYSEKVVLFGTGVGAITCTPEEVASILGMSCDTGFDDLDQFQILIVEQRGLRLGFLRHLGSPQLFSTVCNLSDARIGQIRNALANISPTLPPQFTEYDEPW